MTGLWIVLLILLFLALLVGSYAHHNLTGDRAALRRVKRAGYQEKQAHLPDGTVLNYGEGPNGGPPLLLLHGQAVTWENYARVLPGLAEQYHVYAVDCHGHGKSSFQPEKYTAKAMCQDFLWFIQQVIGEPVYVSGHSSGGLLTVYLAANMGDWVRGIVIEDAPLFSTEMPEKEKTFAYQESFCHIHAFLQQTEEQDYMTYYLQRAYWQKLFGKGWTKMVAAVQKYRTRHPGERPKVWWLPPSINQIWGTISDPYDLHFGEAFYDQSWFQEFDHGETLPRIACPAVFLKATTRWQDGVLMAALSEEDCQRVCQLIPNCRRLDIQSGHGIHDEHPAFFIRAFAELQGMESREKVDKNRKIG